MSIVSESEHEEGKVLWALSLDVSKAKDYTSGSCT